MPSVRIELELCNRNGTDVWMGEVYGPRGGRHVRTETLTEALAAVKDAALAIGQPLPPAPPPVPVAPLPRPIAEIERLEQVKKRRGAAYRESPTTSPAVEPPALVQPRAPRGARGPRAGERALSTSEKREARQPVSAVLGGRA